MEDARSGLSTQLQSFTHNTTEFLRREQELLLHGQGVPQTRTVIERPCPSSWWSGATTTARTCAGCERFIREQRPVLVGVDAGADALIAAGHRPDIVVVGEDGLAQGSTDGRPRQHRLRQGAARRRGRSCCTPTAPGARSARDRLDRLGVRHQTLVGVRHQRGRRAAARRRARRQPDHRGRHPRHPRRVPGPAAVRAREHLPDPPAGRPQAGGRQGRPAAVRRPGAAVAPAAGAARRAARPGRRDRRRPRWATSGGRRSAARCPTYSTGSKDSSRDLFPLPHRLDRLGLPGARRSASRWAGARSRARWTTPWSTR